MSAAAGTEHLPLVPCRIRRLRHNLGASADQRELLVNAMEHSQQDEALMEQAPPSTAAEHPENDSVKHSCTTSQSNGEDWRTRLFRPPLLLALLTVINLLNYTDRYLVSGVLDNIKSDVTAGAQVPDGGCDITISGRTEHHERCLTGTQQGLLGSIFMVGFMVASPASAVLVNLTACE